MLSDANKIVREQKEEIHTLRVQIDGMKRRATRLGISFLPGDEATEEDAA
jgi:hypothetical protein